MPYAVTHVLFSIITVDLYRDYVAKHRKYFTLHTVFIAGFAGLLPDIDIPLNLLLNLFGTGLLHRTITHTILFAIIFLIPGMILWYLKKHKLAMYFFVTAFGILTHILLDYIFAADNAGGILFFYPFSTMQYGLNLLQNATPGLLAAMDAIVLMLWLWHEEIKHKISDFV